MRHRWLVFNVGCIECGVESNVVGTYETELQAKAIAVRLNAELAWRGGGQNSYEVFDLEAPQAEEYANVLSVSKPLAEADAANAATPETNVIP